MTIGFTERGDAGLDLRWETRCRLYGCDGAIAVTKSLTPFARIVLLRLHNDRFPVILHAGCTGLSGILEKNTPRVEDTISYIADLIDRGFPASNIVLRIDPIVPEPPYEDAPFRVLDAALAAGLLPALCVRISFLDNYPHVRARCRAALGRELYNGNWQADVAGIRRFMDRLAPYVRSGKVRPVETCAEGALLARLGPAYADLYELRGCLSTRDLEIMKLDPTQAPKTVNGQNRGGCLCLTCKRELLDQKRPCGNGCIYCYWKDAPRRA